MTKLDDSPAAALLLINAKGSYEIDKRYFPNQPAEPGEIVWPVPMMVVTMETGKRIKAYLATCPSSGAECLVGIEPLQEKSECCY